MREQTSTRRWLGLSRSIGLLMAVMMLGIVFVEVPASAATITLRMAIFKPVKSLVPDWSVPQTSNTLGYSWQPLACDGTDTLSGVGDVRVVGFASSDVAAQPRLRLTYLHESWYEYAFPSLPGGGQEVQVFDSIQDLTSLRSAYNFTWEIVGGVNPAVCSFTAINVPATSESFISRRSTPTNIVQGLEVKVKEYASGVEIPCGSTTTVGRVKYTLLVDPTLTPPGSYDFHVHIETADPIATGPDQDGAPADHRWWEMGWDRTPVPNPLKAISNPAVVGSGASGVAMGGRFTIHFAQQTAAGQPKNEVMCSINAA